MCHRPRWDASHCSITYQVNHTKQIIQLLKALATSSLQWGNITSLLWKVPVNVKALHMEGVFEQEEELEEKVERGKNKGEPDEGCGV